MLLTRLRTQAVASSQPETAVSTTIVLKQCELSFGDTVKAVGDSDLFGSWDTHNAPELHWQEGHDWEAQLDVPSGDCTFKLVIVNSSGGTQWESGDNRSVMVPADAEGGQVSIMCHFNQTSSTEVQVTPASTAQQSSTQPQDAAASAVDDLTDDFAAGDAAAQIPAAQDHAEDVQEQAESKSNGASPTHGSQQQAAAAVTEEVTEAAPEEHLGDSLSVLQGAKSELEEPEALQASSSKSNGAAISSSTSTTAAEAGTAAPQAETSKPEQRASPPSSESQGWLSRLAKASKNFLSLD